MFTEANLTHYRSLSRYLLNELVRARLMDSENRYADDTLDPAKVVLSGKERIVDAAVLDADAWERQEREAAAHYVARVKARIFEREILPRLRQSPRLWGAAWKYAPTELKAWALKARKTVAEGLRDGTLSKPDAKVVLTYLYLTLSNAAQAELECLPEEVLFTQVDLYAAECNAVQENRWAE